VKYRMIMMPSLFVAAITRRFMGPGRSSLSDREAETRGRLWDNRSQLPLPLLWELGEAASRLKGE
jgi:hypothetical protein